MLRKINISKCETNGSWSHKKFITSPRVSPYKRSVNKILKDIRRDSPIFTAKQMRQNTKMEKFTNVGGPTELAIQKLIREKGLESLAAIGVLVRDYPTKVHLKYNTIEADFSRQEVREARGLVLEKGTWDVINYGFSKFFNLGEDNAAPIDWSTAKLMAKLDGTCIMAHYDYTTHKWCFSTTGTAEGEGNVENFHSGGVTGTFSDLFLAAWRATAKRAFPDKEKFSAQADDLLGMINPWYCGYTLCFELCTPYNIVVTPHGVSTVYLTGCRNLKTFEEISRVQLEELAKNIGVPAAPIIADIASDPEAIRLACASLPWQEEGYVAVDSEFRRVKAKGPAYVAVHFFKESTAFWRVLDIVRQGRDEVEEVMATFPARASEIAYLQEAYWKLVDDLKKSRAVMDAQSGVTWQPYVVISSKLGAIQVLEAAAISLDPDFTLDVSDSQWSVSSCMRFPTRGDALAAYPYHWLRVRRDIGDAVNRKAHAMRVTSLPHGRWSSFFFACPENAEGYLASIDQRDLYRTLMIGWVEETSLLR